MGSLKTSIDFACVDFGKEEKDAVNRVLQSNWLASGPENEAFEEEFAEYVGTNFAIAVNSGSSANLLALAALELTKDTEVLSSACGFPATFSPILHCNCRPMLVDYDLATYNIDTDQVIANLNKVKAVIFAHTLGNPVDISLMAGVANNMNVPIIEDCCEAVGAKVGLMGTLATWSFYPAHQMTALGGGGMVTTNSEDLYRRMKSMRDWGKQYTWDSNRGGTVTTYDSTISYHPGYTYTTIGWNFKLPEACAAFGREQLKKLDKFRQIRTDNWNYLFNGLKSIEEIKISPMAEGASPFGFCMRVKNRNEFGLYLEANGIRHRPFFAGNILRQPAFKSEDADKFPVADILMQEALFIGCHTKLIAEDLAYMVETIHAYFSHS